MRQYMAEQTDLIARGVPLDEFVASNSARFTEAAAAEDEERAAGADAARRPLVRPVSREGVPLRRPLVITSDTVLIRSPSNPMPPQ